MKEEIIQIDLTEIFKLLLQRSWIIILSMIIGGVLAYGMTSEFITPKYNSDALFCVNNSKKTVEGVQITSADITASKSLVDTFMVILKSRTTLNEIIDDVSCDYTTDELSSMISSEAVNATEIFKVTVTNTDPVLAEQITSAVVKIMPEKVTDLIEGSSVKIVDTASTPMKPSSPNYQKNILLGIILGMLLSIGIIVVIKLLDQKISTISYLSSTYPELPILAVIPVVKPVTGGVVQSNTKGK